MPRLVRTHLATYLGDIVALAGVALLARDAAPAIGAAASTPALLADLGLVFAGLLGHRVAAARGRESATLALGLLVIGSLGAGCLTDRWWIAAAGGIGAAAIAPHFVVPRRAAVWFVAGLLLTIPGLLADPAAGGLAAAFVVGVGLASMRLARRLRGAAAHPVLELEQALETERLRAAELAGHLSRYETEERKLQRHSLLRGALTRRMGAIEAIALSIDRDLGHALDGAAPGGLDHAVRRSRQRAEQLAGIAGGGRAREQQTTLALVWPRVRDLVGGRMEEGHHLKVGIPADLPAVVGSGESWVQILTALVDNAVEAMPQGGVIEVSAATSARDGFAHVTVADAGRGIPPNVLPHVMEPFYTSGAERGADGLGLSMVASVVEGMEGEVRLSSKVGEGTTVEIDVPFAVVAPVAERTMRLEGDVLLADDDREVRRNMARLLESFGLKVVESDTGTVARALFSARPDRFRVAVLDVVMPGTPVAEVVAGIRELRGAFPVLLVSGYDTMHMVDSVLALGGVRFLRKPFTREELFAALSDLLSVEVGATPPS
ncbi:MAG: ATP-binding protein [Gemmatimonadales bacterium]|nr:ATP-binding protein [Gemmatimonadales bacterium]